MATTFRESRNVELSLLFYLDTNLAIDWPGTTLAKTFHQVFAKDVDLPVVLVRLADVDSTRREVGSSTLENRYLMIVDVFARSDAQRLDMADYIKDKIKEGWIHYDHSHASGDKTTLTRVANRRDWVTEFVSDSRVDAGETVDTKDKFRQTISFMVRFAS